MITEIVSFDLPEGIDRDTVVALFNTTVPRWEQNRDLFRKYYLFDGENGIGGGVYLWPDKAAALAAHDAAWIAKAQEVYGSRPRFQYFETPIVVDNTI